MSSPLNFELSITDLLIPNYSGLIKCALVLANFSTTVSIPCTPLRLVNLKIDSMDKLYLSVFTQSSEVGCLEIPYTSFASGTLDQKFKLYENSISPEKERGQLKTTGEVHLVITRLEEICTRCEGLEKMVREIKVNIGDIEETIHNHPSMPQPLRDEKKASVGIKKPKKNQVLRSGKSEMPTMKFSGNTIVTNSPDSALDLKKMLEDSYRSRQELQLSVAETTEQLTGNLREQREALEQAINERALAMDQQTELAQKVLELEHRNQELVLEIEQKRGEINNLRPRAQCSDSFESEASHLAEALQTSVSENAEFERKLKEHIDSFTNSNSTLNKRIEELTRTKADLQGKLEELTRQNHGLKQENDRYTNLVNELCAQIALLQAEIQTLRARENREKLLQQKLKNEESISKMLKKELDELSKQYNDSLSKSSKENSKLQSEKSFRENENFALKSDLEMKNQEVMRMRKDLEKALSELAALEQHLCVTEDLNKIIDQLSKQNSDSEAEKTRLGEQVSNMAQHIESQSEQIRAYSDKISELETNRLESEEHILNLEGILDELRKDREIYRPNKDDPIDIALSDYVNTRPGAIRVQFDREDQGIYNFGTKKIFVKLEQGKLLIRVGGGYMQVEDFVKLYSPVEIERFSTQKKEQAQKIRQSYLGKYADSLATSKSRTELSPERAIKILKDQMASGNYTPYYAVQLKSPERSINKSPGASDRLSRGSIN